jgi:hypothetical protein
MDTMNRRFALAAVLVGLGFATTGCATGAEGDANDTSENALAPLAPLVGRYAVLPELGEPIPEGKPVVAGVPDLSPVPPIAPDTTPYMRLTFRADGTYEAKRDISMIALCESYPCWSSEAGRFQIVYMDEIGTPTLMLRPEGAAVKYFTFSRTAPTGKTIRLTDGLGRSRSFGLFGSVESTDNRCAGAMDCAVGTCQPVFCAAMCAPDDAFCCPSFCSTAPVE